MKYSTQQGVSNLPSINLIPVMMVGAALSISLSASSVWFAALLVINLVQFLQDSASFTKAFARLFPILTAILFYFALSSFGGTSGETASSFNIASWALILLIVAVAHQKYGDRFFKQGVQQLGFVLLALAVFGILEGVASYNPFVGKFTHILGEWRMGTSAYRASSIFSHAIPFAHMMLIGIAIFILIYKGSTLVKTSVVVIFMLAIAESQTRSALLIAAVLLLLLGFRKLLRSKSNKISPLLIIAICFAGLALEAVVVTGAGLSLFEGIMERIADIGLDDVSVSQRSGAIDLIVGEIMKRGPQHFFFGNGIASSNELISAHTITIENFNTVDNNWLTVLFDYGVFAFILIVFFAIKGLYLLVFDQDSVVACYGAIVTISSFYMFFYSFTMWKSTMFILLTGYYAICCMARLQAGSGGLPGEETTANNGRHEIKNEHAVR